MKNIDHDLRYINIGCGSHPIQDWINYDYNKFIFFARIKILRYILNKLSFIPEGYKQFMYKVIKEDIQFANAGKYIPEKDNSVDVLYSSHMLEHLDKYEADIFVQEAK